MLTMKERLCSTLIKLIKKYISLKMFVFEYALRLNRVLEWLDFCLATGTSHDCAITYRYKKRLFTMKNGAENSFKKRNYCLCLIFFKILFFSFCAFCTKLWFRETRVRLKLSMTHFDMSKESSLEAMISEDCVGWKKSTMKSEPCSFYIVWSSVKVDKFIAFRKFD